MKIKFLKEIDLPEGTVLLAKEPGDLISTYWLLQKSGHAITLHSSGRIVFANELIITAIFRKELV